MFFEQHVHADRASVLVVEMSRNLGEGELSLVLLLELNKILSIVAE